MQTELYRYFDKDGRLLYVGVSLNTLQRAIQHRGSADWWAMAERIEIKRYRTRKLAFAAERRAIKRERPQFNTIHQPSDKERLRTINIPMASRRLAQWGIKLLLDEAYYEIPGVSRVCGVPVADVESDIACGRIIHRVEDFRPERGDVVLVSGRAVYLYLCELRGVLP